MNTLVKNQIYTMVSLAQMTKEVCYVLKREVAAICNPESVVFISILIDIQSQKIHEEAGVLFWMVIGLV